MRRNFSSETAKSHRIFFENLSKELKLSNWEDWYKVKRKDIESKGVHPVLVHYDNSHIEALIQLFPQNDWKVWKFNQVSPSFWKEKKNQRKFFQNLADELNIKKFEVISVINIINC